jgi:hypothetical protein
VKEKPETNPSVDATPANFIRNIIDEDNRTGKWNGRVENAFPARTQWLFAHRARQEHLLEFRYRA